MHKLAKFAMFCLISYALYEEDNSRIPNRESSFFRLASFRDFVANPTRKYAEAVLDQLVSFGLDLRKMEKRYAEVVRSAPQKAPLRMYFSGISYPNTSFGKKMRERNAAAVSQLRAVGVRPKRYTKPYL